MTDYAEGSDPLQAQERTCTSCTRRAARTRSCCKGDRREGSRRRDARHRTGSRGVQGNDRELRLRRAASLLTPASRRPRGVATLAACLGRLSVMLSSTMTERRVTSLDTELRAALGRIARVPQLLVGCDYDGTLAPLVDDPTAAGPLPEAVAAVRALAALPQTVVAVDLGAGAARPGNALPPPERGAPRRQPRLGVRPRLHPTARAGAARAPRPAARRAERRSRAHHPGVRLETKPASVAVHVRGVEPRR